MNLLKQLYRGVRRQLDSRENLHFLMADPRAFRPLLGRVLIDAATHWPRHLPWSPRTILDVGAYQGEVGRGLAELYRPGFVGLVEPLPDLARQLETQAFAPRQRVFACALGRREGRAPFHVLASRHSSSLLEVSPGCDVLFEKPMNEIATVEVPVRTLDSVFAECGLEDLDLLKIDVQGYEMEVFAGGTETLRRTHLLVTEVSFFEHYRGQPQFGAIYEYLHRLGFELRSLFGNKYDHQGLPLQCDAVFLNRADPCPGQGI